MTVDYRVELTIGALSWSINRGDPPSLPEILDGLHVGWQMPQSTFWPTQPEPSTAAFSILAAEADDLVGIDIGTPVFLEVYAGVLTPTLLERASVAIAGRVSQLDGYPMTYPDLVTGDDVEGWRLDVKVADYTADLAETDVAGKIPDFGWLGTKSNIFKICEVAGVPYPDWSDGGAGAKQLVLNSGNFNALTFRDAADRYLKSTADAAELDMNEDNPLNSPMYLIEGFRRGIYRSNLTPAGELDPVTPWRIEWVSRKTPATFSPVVFPARFANLGGGLYGPQIQAPPASAVIGGVPTPIIDGGIVLDADYVDRGAKWTRSKFTEPNTVIVTNENTDAVAGEWRKVTRTNRAAEDPIIAARVTDSLCLDEFHAGFLAEMYLDDDGTPATQWVPSTFTWYASEDPTWPIYPSWFPDADNWLGHSVPVLITGIPQSQFPGAVPDGLAAVVGIPRTVDFYMDGGEFRFDLQLIPRIPRPRNDITALSYADLDNDFPAVDYTDLAEPWSYVDYRLVRTTLIDY